MPNADGKPGVVGDRLPDNDLACLRWWVFRIAKQ